MANVYILSFGNDKMSLNFTVKRITDYPTEHFHFRRNIFTSLDRLKPATASSTSNDGGTFIISKNRLKVAT